MPRIHFIYHSRGGITPATALAIAKILPAITVEHLSIEGNLRASFTVGAVEVLLREVNDQNSINMPTLSITIDANYFPERQEDLNKRTQAFKEQLENSLKELGLPIRGGVCSVWIRLLNADYTSLMF